MLPPALKRRDPRGGRGYVATLPTSGPLLILPPVMRHMYDFGEARCSAGLPWNPVIVRCPFDCDDLEEILNNEEEAVISARLRPWAEHMLRRVQAFEHVQ